MRLVKRRLTVRGLLNRLVVRVQRNEVTTVSRNITTIRAVYANKQVITVAANIVDRCMLPI
jgi:hypothetical protein